MSTHAFKALLVREIEQSMMRLDEHSGADPWYLEGQLDAYAHVLQLIKDDV